MWEGWGAVDVCGMLSRSTQRWAMRHSCIQGPCAHHPSGLLQSRQGRDRPAAHSSVARRRGAGSQQSRTGKSIPSTQAHFFPQLTHATPLSVCLCCTLTPAAFPVEAKRAVSARSTPRGSASSAHAHAQTAKAPRVMLHRALRFLTLAAGTGTCDGLQSGRLWPGDPAPSCPFATSSAVAAGCTAFPTSLPSLAHLPGGLLTALVLLKDQNPPLLSCQPTAQAASP